MRDVAAVMGTSSGLIHHYFDSMDDVLAAAFEQVARQDLEVSARLMGEAGDPVEALRVFFRTYTPADKDWAFQLWLDAWAEAARRPAIQATSRRLNLEWQGLLERTIRAGVAAGAFRARTRPAPRGGSSRCSTGWRSRSSPTARPSRARTSSRWTTGAAEVELGLAAGSLGVA